MQEGRHPRTVIHGVVVPEHWLSPKLTGDTRKMSDAIFPRAHFFAGPEDFDRRVETLSEFLEIVRRPLAEETIQDGIIGIVARTNDKLLNGRVLGHPMHDLHLSLCKLR